MISGDYNRGPMNWRHLTCALSIVATLALAPSAIAGSATHVNFTQWAMSLSGSSRVRTAKPGGVFRYCVSKRLLRMRVYYKTSGPSSGPDNEYWYLNGRFWKHFRDRRLGKSGLFELVATAKDKHRIPSGHWALTISYAKRRVAHTTITVITRHC